MASRKDMRRPDLVVPYMEPALQKNDADIQGAIRRPSASSDPETDTIEELFQAHYQWLRLIGWVAVIFAVQGWMSETPEKKKNQSTPGYFSVGMALLSLGVSYMNLFLPPVPGRPGMGSGTEAPAAVPSS